MKIWSIIASACARQRAVADGKDCSPAGSLLNERAYDLRKERLSAPEVKTDTLHQAMRILIAHPGATFAQVAINYRAKGISPVVSAKTARQVREAISSLSGS